MKIGIIGAGYAGVAAALEAARKGAEVTLFSNEEFLPYFRPRIIGVAFGQTNADDVYMHPLEWYSVNNINLLLNSAVTSIRTLNDGIALYSKEKEYCFDRIIIAFGASPVVPNFAIKALGKRLFTIWTLRNALDLKKKLEGVKSIIIIGGGLIGLETALRASDNGIKVTILERAKRLFEYNFSVKGSEVIRRLFHTKGIDVLLSAEIEEVSTTDESVKIRTHQTSISSDIAILCIGCKPEITLASKAAINLNNGITVDDLLKTSSRNIFASGDIAEYGNLKTIYSVQRALAQGKIAGLNSSCSSYSEMTKYLPAELSLDLKYKDFEIHSVG